MTSTNSAERSRTDPQSGEFAFDSIMFRSGTLWVIMYRTYVSARRIALAATVASLSMGAWTQSLKNADFESPGVQGATPDGWTVLQGSFSEDNGKHFAGKYSGKLDANGAKSAAYQEVAVAPGASYELSGYWRNGDKTMASDVTRIEIQWLDAAGTNIGAAGPIDSGDNVSNWVQFKLGPV